MAKLRVHEVAKQLGITSKEALAKLEDMGEFVSSASSTIEPPVVKRLKAEFKDDASSEDKPKPAQKPAPKKPAAKPSAPAKKPATKPGQKKTTTAGPSTEPTAQKSKEQASQAPEAPKPSQSKPKPAAPTPRPGAAPKPGKPGVLGRNRHRVRAIIRLARRVPPPRAPHRVRHLGPERRVRAITPSHPSKECGLPKNVRVGHVPVLVAELPPSPVCPVVINRGLHPSQVARIRRRRSRRICVPHRR